MEESNIDKLLRQYKHQVFNCGDKENIDKLACEIKEEWDIKGLSIVNEFMGYGCCSEYRNSIMLKYVKMKDILKPHFNLDIPEFKYEF